MTATMVVRYPPPPYEHREEATAWRGGCWSARHDLPKRANPYLPGAAALAWTAGWIHEQNQESSQS